jgi:hypothetical protein
MARSIAALCVQSHRSHSRYAFGVFIPAAVFALGKIAVALTGRH